MTAIEAARAPIPAAGVVCWRGEEVLLIKRARPPLAGQWSIPGGRIRLGETAAGAALRELREETGVRARLTGLVDVVDLIAPATAADPAFHYILIDYAAEWVAGAPMAGDDAEAARFAAFAEAMAAVADPRTRAVIRAARAAKGGGTATDER